jgi:hypothetical protein
MEQTQEEQTLSLVKHQPSERLTTAVKNCALGFMKVADAVHEAIEIGKEEGYHPKEVGKLIRIELKNNHFSDSSIRRYLPAEAKDQSKIRSNDFAVKMSANTRPEHYQSEQLTKYPKAYLIEIIKWYEQKYVIKHVVKQVKSIEPTPKIKQKPVLVQNTNKPYKNWTNKPLDNDKIQEIIRLRKQGKYIQEIADQLNTSKVSVIRYLKMNKITA